MGFKIAKLINLSGKKPYTSPAPLKVVGLVSIQFKERLRLLVAIKSETCQEKKKVLLCSNL
jgi:hypothetical protein